MSYIPVIDLAPLWLGLESSEAITKAEIQVAQEIGRALHEIGFMYLTNHGIQQEIINEGFRQSSNFFVLPLETKLKYKKIPGNPHGFTRPGQELLNPSSVFEYRESFDIAGNEQRFPGEVPQFQPALKTLEKACTDLLRKLLHLLGIYLRTDDSDFFIKCSSHLNNPSVANNCDFRAIHYPAIEKELDIPEGSIRTAEHTDYEVLTLLFQDDKGGLEVKGANGNWIAATPIENTVVVNTGDLLEIWSSGYFAATLHRVIIPPEQSKRVSRYSFAYFYAPDDSTVITPIISEVLKETNQNYKQWEIITAGEHIMERMRTAYQY